MLLCVPWSTSHYLVASVFILHSDHEALKYIQVGVFMVRVSEPKEISVQVPEISSRQNGE